MSEKTEVAAEAVVEEAKVEVKTPTIAEITGTKAEEPKVVPEAAFLELKKENKQLAREMKALQSRIEDGATDKQVASSLSDIAEEFGVEPKFLSKLVSAIRKDVDTEAETKISSRLKPFEEEKKAQAVRSAFDTHYERSLSEMEDYKKIVNKDVIFSLSLQPQNAQKTLPQLIEETYGGAIAGRKSIETTQSRAGTQSGVLDFDRANTDSEYLSEVLKDPVLKKQFNEKAQEIARKA